MFKFFIGTFYHCLKNVSALWKNWWRAKFVESLSNNSSVVVSTGTTVCWMTCLWNSHMRCARCQGFGWGGGEGSSQYLTWFTSLRAYNCTSYYLIVSNTLANFVISYIGLKYYISMICRSTASFNADVMDQLGPLVELLVVELSSATMVVERPTPTGYTTSDCKKSNW